MKSINNGPYNEHYSSSTIEKYKENIFVGYRYFDLVKDDVLYPFGYGLSYSTFKYDYKGMKLEDGILYISIEVTNTSNVFGADVIQLYIGKNENTKVFKADKELKDFQKVYLKPLETKNVVLSFKIKDISYYNNIVKKFVVENGTYPIYIATNCHDIIFTKEFVVMNNEEYPTPYSQTIIDAYKNPSKISDNVFESTLDHNIEYIKEDKFTLETSLLEFKKTKSGRFVLNLILKFAGAKNNKADKIKDENKKAEYLKNNEFLLKIIPQNNLRAIMQASGGFMQLGLAKLLLWIANLSKQK